MNSGNPLIETSGIEYLYNPKSIAIIGASPHQRKPGGRPLVALKKREFKGTVVAVNPQYDEIAMSLEAIAIDLSCSILFYR